MTRRSPALVRAVLAGVVLVTVAACGDGNGAAEPVESETATTAASDEPLASTAGSTADPTPGSTAVERQQPEGFTTVTVRITEPDGEVCEVCMWLADDPVERGRGLMGVTDLGDAAGMVFQFEDATTGAFYMFQTPSPLSIAWFAPDGTHVGSADMGPCLVAEPGECPLYSPGAEYDVAIEVFEGGLQPLGLVAGSRVELIEGSEAERCPAAG
jgi:uncharacterized membrane protein (UPF0127 family)